MLAVAIAFGFFVVTAIDGLASGAVSNLENTIMQMMGGDVFIQGVVHRINEDGSVNKQYSEYIKDSNYIENLVLN